MTPAEMTPAELLLSLTELDRESTKIRASIEAITSELTGIKSELTTRRSRLDQGKKTLQELTARQVEEEGRLKEEEKRVVERHKQLTTVGGVKSAKLVERDADAASKVLSTLEERVMRTLSEIEKLQGEVLTLEQALTELEGEYETRLPQHQQSLDTLGSSLKEYQEKRQNLLQQLDNRHQQLYTRVQGRFAADAVAIVHTGACRSCYRSLPPQLFNLVLAGESYHQCPGCARILVYKAPEAA